MNKPQKRLLKIITSMIGAAAIAALWQNCSRVTLEAKPNELLSLSPALKLKGSVCPQSTTAPGAPTSFLFVVDMSNSNIGAPLKDGAFSYWDPTQATDLGGNRFDAVQYFLDNCNASANARYAVIGFSTGVGKVVGSGFGAKWNSDCTSMRFGDAGQAGTVLAGFRSEQQVESQWYDQWSKATNNYLTTTSYPPIMRGTDYIAALQCADQMINKDLTSTSSTELYHVIFITDGAPNDPLCTKGLTPAQSTACFDQQINLPVSDMRQSALSLGKDLRLSTVFYGQLPGGASGQVPPILGLMSNDGGTPAPMQLATFQNNQKALCSLVTSEMSVNFTPDSFFAVNLTTIKKGNELKPDSDMDGIPDDEEAALGYDPLNPRSQVSGVLDGICERLGGLANCRNMRNQIQCNPYAFTGYLTDCDIKILKLDKSAKQNPTLGLDTDGDGIPDFIEIIKGTDPVTKDGMADPDGDGNTNQNEIFQCSDPFTPDASFSPKLMNLYSVIFNPQSQDCPGGGWDINVSQTAVSQTQEVTGFPTAVQELNHGATDQLIWMGYRMVPKNSTGEQITFYGKIVNVKVSADGLTQTATPNFVNNSMFSNLGQVLP